MKETNCSGAVPRKRAVGWWKELSIGILAVAFMGMAAGLDAKKPVKPPPEPDPETPVMEEGLVYFEDFDFVYELDIGTSTLRTLFEINWELEDYVNTLHIPSDVNHPISPNREGRWFLVETEAPEDGTYPITEWRPNPITRRAIYAVNEDGVAFKLTEKSNLEPCNTYGDTSPRWVKNDSEIWFIARELDDDGDIILDSYGVYHIGIEFLGDGTVSVTDPEMVPFSPIFEITSGATNNLYAIFTQFDASPDGSVLYYTKALSYANPIPLFKKDLNINGEETLVYPESGLWIYVEYSLEEDAILGKSSDLELTRVQADGSNPISLATSDRKTGVGNTAVWSPSGAQVLYPEGKTVRGQSVTNLKVITSDDGSTVGNALVITSGRPTRLLGWFE